MRWLETWSSGTIKNSEGTIKKQEITDQYTIPILEQHGGLGVWPSNQKSVYNFSWPSISEVWYWLIQSNHRLGGTH